MNDFISTLGAEYEGCLGMEMAKRPGSAGAGAIIEGDEDRYTEEALLKAEESKSKHSVNQFGFGGNYNLVIPKKYRIFIKQWGNSH